MPDNEPNAATQTSTTVQPVDGPGHRAGEINQTGGEDPSDAPEQNNQSAVPGDPRPFNEGQPEQPDARG